MDRNGGMRSKPAFGNELRRQRKARRWSLRTLGVRTRYDYSYLGRIEKGERRASAEVAEACDRELESGGTLIAAWRKEHRVSRPAQLPAPPARFVGRDDELAELCHTLLHRPLGAPTIVAIDGPPSTGKTALALRCASELEAHFFDGQLYADLGGFAAPQSGSADPSAVLRWFCTALGADTIPASIAERAAQYRSLLADRRVLIMLDNVAGSRQIEHLLPGAGNCAVIVTSRSVLSGLAVFADAHRVSIGPLAERDSVTLISQLIGADRADREPEAVRALTQLCGHLPLALRLAAGRIVTHAETSIDALVSEISRSDRRLDYLEPGDSPGIRSTISWSYAKLPADIARTFRLLGIHGGSTISASAIAALTGVDPVVARRHLHELGRMHLVELGSNDTARIQDLLRAYAYEKCLAEDEVAMPCSCS